MQSPVKTIHDLVKTNWSIVADGLKVTDINWRYGEPEDLSSRFIQRKISAEFSEMTTPKEKRSLIRSVARKVVVADFWILLDPAKTRESAVGDKQKIEDEVERIVQAVELSATDLDLVHVLVTRSLDSEGDRVMRTQFEIMCQYQR